MQKVQKGVPAFVLIQANYQHIELWNLRKFKSAFSQFACNMNNNGKNDENLKENKHTSYHNADHIRGGDFELPSLELIQLEVDLDEACDEDLHEVV